MTKLKKFLKGSETPKSLIQAFEAIERASAVVANEVNRAGLGADIYGAKGRQNVQGEQQQKLDVYANEVFIKELRECGAIAGLASEELEHALQFDESIDGEYVMMIDPLDGSSNIDVNVAIGTIFAIYKRISKPGGPVTEVDFLQPGKMQVAAGYVNYSVSTQLIMSTGSGVHIFTLDPDKEEFHLVRENVQMPDDGKVYSINEVNFDDFDDNLKRFVQYCRDKRTAKGIRQYTGRYIGSLVADFHRNMLKGGVYVYPATSEAPNGKLRLLYEGNPMAFLAAQSGGAATDGKQNILDIVPAELHQRCPLYVGCRVMMEEVMRDA